MADEPMQIDESAVGKQMAFDFAVNEEGEVSVVLEPEFIQDPCTYREHNVSSSSSNTALVIDQPTQASMGKQIAYGPLKYVRAGKCKSLKDLMDQLNAALPLNEYNLPEYIFRPDMLDYVMITSVLEQISTTTTSFPPAQDLAAGLEDISAMLDSAMMQVSYSEGYPTIGANIPFWNKMEFEPQEAYDAFIRYVELGGARKLVDLEAFDINDLNEWNSLFFWSFRVTAFDLYRVVDHQRRRVQRMLLVEDDHYTRSSKIMKKLDMYFENLDLSGDDVDLTPEKAVAMLEKLVKIQRVSVGLPANGESKENNEVRQDVNVNVLMNRAQGSKKPETDGDDLIDILTDDPDLVDDAQDLIIRMQQARVINE